jgi:hypothetical protein
MLLGVNIASMYDCDIPFPFLIFNRKLKPSWDEISDLMKSTKTLQVATLNCEDPLKNSGQCFIPFENTINRTLDFCTDIGVDRYPSIFFVGYGNFHYPGAWKPSIVRYEADIIPGALYDWIRVMSFTSRIHRVWSSIKSFSPFRSGGESSKEKSLTRIRSLESQVDNLASQLEKYRVFEVFDKMPDRGDVFPLLASLPPDEVSITFGRQLSVFHSCYFHYMQQNLPLRMCVAEYTTEYCKYVFTHFGYTMGIS